MSKSTHPGGKVPKFCLECGTALPAGAKFCAECGTATATSVDEKLTADDGSPQVTPAGGAEWGPEHDQQRAGNAMPIWAQKKAAAENAARAKAAWDAAHPTPRAAASTTEDSSAGQPPIVDDSPPKEMIPIEDVLSHFSKGTQRRIQAKRGIKPSETPKQGDRSTADAPHPPMPGTGTTSGTPSGDSPSGLYGCLAALVVIGLLWIAGTVLIWLINLLPDGGGSNGQSWREAYEGCIQSAEQSGTVTQEEKSFCRTVADSVADR